MATFVVVPQTMLPKPHAFLPDRHLVGSTGDEEPLVNAWVDGGRSEVLIGWDGRKLFRVDAARGLLDRKVGAVICQNMLKPKFAVNLRRDITWLGLASDELLPGLSTLTDDISGVSVTASASYTT